MERKKKREKIITGRKGKVGERGCGKIVMREREMVKIGREKNERQGREGKG